MNENGGWEDQCNIFPRYINKHRANLQLIFTYTKLFGVFNYFCDFATQGIDVVLVQVNFRVNQVDPGTHFIIIFSVPEWRVGTNIPTNMQNSQLVPQRIY